MLQEYLGLGIPDLWHLQASLFAKQCLQYGSLYNDPTGILLRNVLQYMRIEMGVPKSPMSSQFKILYKCVTKTQFFPFWDLLGVGLGHSSRITRWPTRPTNSKKKRCIPDGGIRCLRSSPYHPSITEFLQAILKSLSTVRPDHRENT